MKETDIARVQAYLRATLGNTRIFIDQPPWAKKRQEKS